MSNLVEHAKIEFLAAGWINSAGEYSDSMQKMMCEQVIELLNLFDGHGHSGSSAPYAINLFKSLAAFEPIVPLSGDDSEWSEVSSGTFQNKRCSHVFKDDDGKAYDTEGIIFYDIRKDDDGKEYKSHFTCRESRVYINFPYTPIREYRERSAQQTQGE